MEEKQSFKRARGGRSSSREQEGREREREREPG